MNNVIILKERKELETLTAYIEAKQMASEWSKKEKELKAMLESWIVPGETITIGTYNVRHDVSFRNGLDTALLKKELPELWTEYNKQTETHKLIIA